MPDPSTGELDVESLRARVADLEETLRAIRHGEVDALVGVAEAGEGRLFTLGGADATYRRFVESMTDGAATVSTEGVVLYANQAMADLVSSTCPHIVGRPVLDLVMPSSHSRLSAVLSPGRPAGSVEAVLLTSDQRQVPVLVGASSLMIGDAHVTCLTVTDLTSERRVEAELEHTAQHDALTGLPNRTLLIDRIEHALARRVDASHVLALYFCDVDGFKNVNDAHGHQVGDEVLRAISDQLSGVVRPEDTVARIGGDEFVVLCDELDDVAAATVFAARLQDAVAAPVVTGAGVVDVTVSIGVAVAMPVDDASPDTLLRDADEAMYKAKRQGPNEIELFDEALRTGAARRLAMLADLRGAADRGELRLVYQPVVGLEHDTVVGVEALIRWQHPTRGLVPPDEFIPFAERSGLVMPIGSWVMREACRQGALWMRESPAGVPFTMSVNVSGRQLSYTAGLLDTVKDAILESDFDPGALIVEVTESTLVDDAEMALRVLTDLKELGVRIAIDDFGTGYSSLLYLKRFPVDLLKIDRSFIRDLSTNPEDRAIVQSVIDLAQAFGIGTVAEGVETPGQLRWLRDAGCELGQGFLWSPGRAAADLGSPVGAILPHPLPTLTG